MQNRALLLVMAAILAAGITACDIAGGSPIPSPAVTASAAATASPESGAAATACGLDPFGCVEIADGDPIVIGTALAITGPLAPLGLDSQYGAQVALNLRQGVLGHEIILSNKDDHCTSDGGTAAAEVLVSQPDLVGVVGTSCSNAAVPAAQILSTTGILLVSPSNTAPR